MARPICFVLMPFGKKPDPSGNLIDFDAVYERLVAPSIKEADLDPIRADEEVLGGIIHKPMFERLILCPFAVADLTLANANVFYELGVRHAARPHSTVSLFAEGSRLPFDVSMIRAVLYRLDVDGTPKDVQAAQQALVNLLREARQGIDDSPVFQLMELPWRGQLDQLAHEKTDVFRDRARYSATRKQQLADARRAGADHVARLESEIVASAGSIANEEIGVLVDLFLSYRATKAWKEMIRLAAEFPAPLAKTVMIREQLALALNRQAGQFIEARNAAEGRALRDRAIRTLEELISERGPSSETNGILGRIYKDCWDEALASGSAVAARGWLQKAIRAYLDGFEADWRDAYPGINAVTLMELQEPPDERRHELARVVAYSVERKIASKQPDYWDYATRLELAVLLDDRERAEAALADALANRREAWESETTARNLRLIREARQRRGDDVEFIASIERELAGSE